MEERYERNAIPARRPDKEQSSLKLLTESLAGTTSSHGVDVRETQVTETIRQIYQYYKQDDRTITEVLLEEIQKQKIKLSHQDMLTLCMQAVDERTPMDKLILQARSAGK